MLPRHSFAYFLVGLASSVIMPAFAASQPLASVDSTQLDTLEQKFFSHSYAQQDEAERVSRLEKMVFGESQPGDVHDRLMKVVDSTKPKTEVPTMVQHSVVRSTPVETQKNTSEQSIAYSSKYPRVTELEQQLLGRTYTSEPIRDRLDRLEGKAFGHASNCRDMASRVDRLNEYAVAFDMPGSRNPSQFYYSSSANVTVSHHTDRFTGVADQIESMELTAYGAKHTNKTLLQRVNALEETTYGVSRIQTNEDLTTRVSHLWASMKPGEQPLQTAQGFAVEPSRDWVARQAVLAQMQAEKPVAPSVAQHHTFLKKIGKAVAVAGELAATAINSAANPYAMNGGANPTFGSNFGGMTGMH